MALHRFEGGQKLRKDFYFRGEEEAGSRARFTQEEIAKAGLIKIRMSLCTLRSLDLPSSTPLPSLGLNSGVGRE